MQINDVRTDDLNISLSIVVDKADWAEPKKKKLNNYRRNAEIRGFRKGMAPMSLIEKIYGGQAMGEALNAIVSEQLDKYITGNNLEIIGEPLPSEKEIANDWENGESLTFEYDLGLRPEVKIGVSAEDKLDYYTIAVSDESKAEYKNELLRQHGTLVDSEAIAEDDFVTADFEQGETKIEDTYIALRSITDGRIKKGFIGLAVGATKEVDIVKAFPNETDRAAMLHMSKEELEALAPKWKVTIKSIRTFANAPETQETWDAIFGEGKVKSAEEFDSAVAERLATQYAQESDYKFSQDIRKYLIEKAAISLPEAFLKRWLFAANEGKFTMEDIEKEFDSFLEDFRWEMIRTEIMKANDLKITREAMENEARSFVSYQYAMYGISYLPEEQLKELADKVLADQQQARRLFEKVENDMVCNFARQSVTLNSKEVTLEKMREMTK
ncbi:MAG: trigger factor [Bacteroidales bacterium]|nr:trigger factor [Bacteroidales bacterium]